MLKRRVLKAEVALTFRGQHRGKACVSLKLHQSASPGLDETSSKEASDESPMRLVPVSLYETNSAAGGKSPPSWISPCSARSYGLLGALAFLHLLVDCTEPDWRASTCADMLAETRQAHTCRRKCKHESDFVSRSCATGSHRLAPLRARGAATCESAVGMRFMEEQRNEESTHTCHNKRTCKQLRAQNART